MLFGGTKKKTTDPLLKNPDDWTDEERKQVTTQASNWGNRGGLEGYTFFNGPTPKTGVQEDMPDFFSGDARADVEVPPQLLVFGGLAALLAVGVAGVLTTA